MRKLVENLPPMMEQEDLRSRIIERSGFDDHGIIFLTLSNDPKLNPGNEFSLSDLENLDPDIFLGSVLENPAITGPEGHFTIFGGYYCKKIRSGTSNAVELAKVFGIAKESSKGFGFKDGDDKIIGDTWKLQNHFTTNERVLIDERELPKAKDGWTFIVGFVPGFSIFPVSLEPINIFSNCPEISFSSLSHEPAPDKDGEIRVHFTVDVDNGLAGDLSWDFGDGSKDSSQDLTRFHDYKQQRGEGPPDVYKVRVDSSGPGGCKDTIDTEVRIPRIPHPSLAKVEELTRRESTDKKSVEVDFQASLKDPSNPHTRYEWDFGDGKPPVKGTDLTISHSFDKKDTPFKPTIQVDGKGPDSCHSSVLTKVLISPLPVVCPVIGQVKQINRVNLNGGEKTQFKLQTEFTGASPRQFVWTWDDKERVITNGPEVDIVLDRSDEDHRPVIITVETLGPGDCRGKSDICVHVPGLGKTDCPWYMKAFPFVISFFMTMLISAVITCYIGISMERAVESATDHLYTWTIVMAFLTIITGFMWPFLGGKINCPPTKCSVLSIAWVSMFGVAVFVAMIQLCLPGFWLLFIVFVLLAIVFRYLYQKSCRGKINIVHEAIFILVAMAGVFVAYFMHATRCLDCL